MTSAIIPHREHIGQLTGVRGVAAIAVLALHYQVIFYGLLPGTTVLRPLVDSGGLGLLMFFTLSGFVISYNYFDRMSAFTATKYRKFMSARIARMYPVHIFMLLAVLALYILARIVGVSMPNPEYYRVDSFIVNVFMLQGAISANPWNGPAWTITLDLASYILFPIFVVLLMRYRTATAAYLSAFVVIVAGTAAMMAMFARIRTEEFGGVINWMHVTFEFTCGCLLYMGWRLSGFVKGVGWDVTVVAAVSGILAIIFFTDGNEFWRFTTIPLLTLAVLGVAGSRGPVAAILSSRPVFWLGQISYSLYLSHVTVRAIVRQVLPPESYESSGLGVRIGVTAAYFIVAILVGAIIFHWVEEPGRKGFRRWEQRWEDRHATKTRVRDDQANTTAVAPFRFRRRTT